jgi:hypothetical protein
MSSVDTRHRANTDDGGYSSGYTDLVDLDHAEQLTSVALAPSTDSRVGIVLEGVLNVRMRVGVHSGPVVAGVVGSKDLRYHVFGESLRIAESMESNSIPGRILCSAVTYQLLQNDAAAAEFDFSDHDPVDLRKEGLGVFETYLVDRAGMGTKRRGSGGQGQEAAAADGTLRRKNSLSQMRMLMKAKAQAAGDKIPSKRPHSSPVGAARRPLAVSVTPLT